MAPTTVEIASPNVRYTAEHIEAQYEYSTTEVERQANGRLVVHPKTKRYTFRTEQRVPKLGLMLVGWGGNNGSTLTGAVLANRLGLCWHTKEGRRCPDWLGSVTQSSTLSLGMAPEGEVFVPMKDLLPMVDPNDLVIDGWDISSLNMAEAMERAKVLDYDLQRQLRPHMEKLCPRPSIFLPDFVAANQAGRADNVLAGTKQSMMEKIRQDIRDFKAKSHVDKVIVLWTANTERFSEVRAGLNDTAENLLASIRRGESEVSPSTLFAVACVLEGVAYINGSPQNTFVPGLLQLAEQRNVFIGGDDFKSGQTKDYMTEVCAGGLPGECWHQTRFHRQLQPPGQQRWQEPLRPADLPLQGDLQEQRGGRHGGQQLRAVQARGEAGPHGGHQVRALRGRQQARPGRVHVGDPAGRAQHAGHPQHVRGLAAGGAADPGPGAAGRAVPARAVPGGGRGGVPELPPGAERAGAAVQGAAGAARHPRHQRLWTAARLHREPDEGVPGPGPQQPHAAGVQAPPPPHPAAPRHPGDAGGGEGGPRRLQDDLLPGPGHRRPQAGGPQGCPPQRPGVQGRHLREHDQRPGHGGGRRLQ